MEQVINTNIFFERLDELYEELEGQQDIDIKPYVKLIKRSLCKQAFHPLEMEFIYRIQNGDFFDITYVYEQNTESIRISFKEPSMPFLSLTGLEIEQEDRQDIVVLPKEREYYRFTLTTKEALFNKKGETEPAILLEKVTLVNFAWVED